MLQIFLEAFFFYPFPPKLLLWKEPDKKEIVLA